MVVTPFFLSLHCTWLPTHVRALSRHKKQRHFDRQPLLNAKKAANLLSSFFYCRGPLKVARTATFNSEVTGSG